MPAVASVAACQNVTVDACVAPINGEKCGSSGGSCGWLELLHVASNVTWYRAVAGAGVGAGPGSGCIGVVGVINWGAVGAVDDEQAGRLQSRSAVAQRALPVTGFPSGRSGSP
jgi:hypothetical protein